MFFPGYVRLFHVKHLEMISDFIKSNWKRYWGRCFHKNTKAIAKKYEAENEK